jgi:hypothetical protein
MALRVLPYVYWRHGEPSDARWPAVREEEERRYVALVEQIDWTRVLLEASGRHVAFGHGTDDTVDERHLDDDEEAPCGECVQEALLATDTLVDWRTQAEEQRSRSHV